MQRYVDAFERSCGTGPKPPDARAPAGCLQLASWHSNQVVLDPQPHFSMNEHVTLKEQVKVFAHRASQAVLNGNYRRASATRFQRVKDLN